MTALDERLARALEVEPPLGDAVDAAFHRADQLRRRRIRAVLLAGLIAIVLVAALGYGLISVLMPAAAGHPMPRPSPGPSVDPVAVVLAEAADLTVEPRSPGAGLGWRQYTAVDRAGHPRGVIKVAVYAAPDGLCLPVLANRDVCALAEAAGDVEYARYRFDDVNAQVNEVIARRPWDGRTVAVMAAGERGTGAAEAGRPALTAAETARAATDRRLMDAFGEAERCNPPAPACPVLRVAVPAAG